MSHDPTPAPEQVADGFAAADEYQAFQDRITELYRTDPRCQQARRHSFSAQAGVAFRIAMEERLAADRAAAVAEAYERAAKFLEAHDVANDGTVFVTAPTPPSAKQVVLARAIRALPAAPGTE